MRLLSPFTPTLYYGNLVNRRSPLNRGLVSWWINLPLGGKGGTWFDIAGKNHGTLTNGPTWGGTLGASGQFGRVIFDGTDDVVVGPTPTGQLILAAPFTVGVAFRPGEATRGDVFNVWNNGETVTGSQWDLISGLPGNSQMAFYLATATGAVLGANTTAILTTTDMWIAVATWDGTNANLYVEGSVYESASGTPASVSLSTSPTAYRIGDNAFPDGAYQGSVFTAAAWNGRKFSETDARAWMKEVRLGYPTTLNRIRLPVIGEAAAVGGLGARNLFTGWLTGHEGGGARNILIGQGVSL